tara:strand:- start:133 stop:1368 length:1236 start_codon:yes stop_codon:yes gene_type:complete
MAKEDKKSWLDRAWGWRDNLREKAKPVFDRMEQADRSWGEKIKKQVPVFSDDVKDYWKNRDERKNWKDAGRIFGNYLDWDRRMIGAATRTIPRAAGFDWEFYNPLDLKESAKRNTFIPGLDFKKWDPSNMGVGAAQYLDSPLGNFLGGQYENTLSLENPKSVASKFLNQYDSEDAYSSWINDNITDKDRENIRKNVDDELNWFDWANEYPHNPVQDFEDQRNELFANKTWGNFLDPYMKEVGDKYKERMLNEFGAYDTNQLGFMNNLGYEQPIPMSTPEGDPYTMDSEWFDKQVDDNPDNDSSYPEEFNFGAVDPLYEEWNKEFPFKYDEPEHYDHWMTNVPAAVTSGGGVLRGIQSLAKKLPKWMQTGLKVAHPASTQLGKWPTTRGIAQTAAIPALSEKFKQDYYYPSE